MIVFTGLSYSAVGKPTRCNGWAFRDNHSMPKQITPSALSTRMGAGEKFLVIDVRQPEEYAITKIAGSTLIPLPELMSRVGEVEPADGMQIVVYCHHGVRSMTGAALLERAGNANVLSLAGGIDAWSCQVDPNVPRY